MKRKLVLLAKIAVATGLLYYLLRSGQLDLRRLVERLAEPQSWFWIVLAQVLIFSMLFCCAIRWHLLLRAQGIRYRLREIFSLTMIGFFFNQFAPGSTGGDLVKAYYIAVERRERRAAGVTTVVLDRVLGLIVLVGLAGVAILLNLNWIRTDPYLNFLAGFVAVGLLAFFIGALLFFNERVRELRWVRAAVARLPFQGTLGRIQNSVFRYRDFPGTISLVVILSVCVQVSVVLSGYCFCLALGGGEIGLASVFVLVPIAHLAMAIPVSPPGGLGVGEWAFAELFRKVGYADGGLMALLQRVNWYLWALGGLVCFLGKRKSVQRAIALARQGSQATDSEEFGSPPEARDPQPASPTRELERVETAESSRAEEPELEYEH